VAEKDEAKRRVVASAGFVNQDGTEVLRARFAGFPGRIRLVR
jgi:3-hydroxybutyryl-CoA dehydratase